ncbi:MAG: spermidine/putrescine ABC transporter ATP-binding protein [Acidobacteria bacterium]|nr:MAG: spermidine/putrescine ABC transporter ATP-binding protein [Acidobacteriota bacterium]
MSAVLEFRGLRKLFGKQVVLEDINLSVCAGEFLTFLGPSGSGKTTLLRLVGGFEPPDEGHIFLQGEEISHLPPHKRRVNTVFQNYALFPHLNVFQNIAFGLQNVGLDKTEIESRVKSVLEMVQLIGYELRFPGQLSGGQQQRVALVRALVMQPAVLLLDEPLGALDQKLRKQMQSELKALQRKVGLTFVFVTHDQEEALSLSDRIVVLNQGRLEQVGSPQEIYDRPKSRFVADFMGMQNIFPLASLQENGEIYRCWTQGGQEIHVPKANHPTSEVHFFGIHPAKIRLKRTPPGNHFDNILKGIIRQGLYLGSTHTWAVEAGNCETWMVAQSLYDSSDEGFSLQDEVYLCWDGNNGVLFS